jgi:hypothetical protein
VGRYNVIGACAGNIIKCGFTYPGKKEGGFQYLSGNYSVHNFTGAASRLKYPDALQVISFLVVGILPCFTAIGAAIYSSQCQPRFSAEPETTVALYSGFY